MARSRLVVLFLIIVGLVSLGAADDLGILRRDLTIPENYGTHRVFDATGDGLPDLLFLTKAGEGDTPGVLTVVVQEAPREFALPRRFQAPAGTRDVFLQDVDGDGAAEVVLLHHTGLSMMRIANKELQRDVSPVTVSWPLELGQPAILSAVWEPKLATKGKPATLVVTSFGFIGAFDWVEGAYRSRCVVRTDAGGVNYSRSMGMMISRFGKYRQADAHHASAAESLRFTLETPALYLIDMNNDAALDLVLCKPTRGRLTVFLNDAKGVWSATPSLELDRSRVTQAEDLIEGIDEIPSLIDFNGDGLPDLLTVKRGDRQSRETVTRAVYLATAPLTYPEKPNQVLSLESITGISELNDLTGDGRPDLMAPMLRVNFSSILRTGLTGALKYTLRIHPLQPPDLGGVFQERPSTMIAMECGLDTLQQGNGPVFSTAWDVTGDGRGDLLISNELDGFEVYAGEPGLGLNNSAWTEGEIARGMLTQIVDMDGDGMPDFLDVTQEPGGKSSQVTAHFLLRP